MVLFVPSVERDGETPIDQQRRVDASLEMFGSAFGGATAWPRRYLFQPQRCYHLTPMRRLLAVVLGLCGLASCGTTVGVIPFSAPGRRTISVMLDAGSDVRFWTEFDATYGGAMAIEYDVELEQDGSTVAGTVCRARDLGMNKVCTIRIEAGDTHEIHCRMGCLAHVPKTGPTLVQATLYLGGRPVALHLERANLIVKQ